jgi:hypothetical protein
MSFKLYCKALLQPRNLSPNSDSKTPIDEKHEMKEMYLEVQIAFD